MIVNCIAIIGIGICIGENLLLGIGIGSVVIFLYRWNPTVYVTVLCVAACHTIASCCTVAATV